MKLLFRNEVKNIKLECTRNEMTLFNQLIVFGARPRNKKTHRHTETNKRIGKEKLYLLSFNVC